MPRPAIFSKMNDYRKAKTLVAILVSLLTLVVFLPDLRNGFVNWDDDIYVYNNSHIQRSLQDVIAWAFSEFYAGNWHPLTWVSHGVDCAMWGMNPLGHHLINNLLHALNSMIVVFLIAAMIDADKKRRNISGLSGSMLDEKGSLIAAGTAGVLFGIHPLHVESVAWVSERKDLLSTLFFCLSLLSYIRYAEGSSDYSKKSFRLLYYLVTLGLFVCALLSKSMAVTLPCVLIILDWYPLQRIRSANALRTVLIEKVPFFVLSAISSIITVLAQRGAGYMAPIEAVGFTKRFVTSAYAIVSYLGKMLLPVGLIPFYPYSGDATPFLGKYLGSFVAIVVITAICVILISRGQRVWIAAWGYYLVTLLPVIGIIQVGMQSMADRYTYLPSLGPFLLLGAITARGYEGLEIFKQWNMRPRLVGIIIGIFLLGLLSSVTVKQITIWRDSLSLWDYVIAKTPENIPFVFNSRAAAYASKGEYEHAIRDLHVAIALRPDYPMALSNRGKLYDRMGYYDQAIADLTRAISIRPDSFEALNNRGISYWKKGLQEKAISDFDRALAIKPDYVEALCNRGLAYSLNGQYGNAVESYTRAIAVAPGNAPVYVKRAYARFRAGNKADALDDLQRACGMGNEEGCRKLKELVMDRSSLSSIKR